MKKKNFVSMVLGTVGGILFAIGMCMCLLPEWGAFTQGVIIAAVGIVVLLAMLLVRRKMEGKPAVKLNGRALIMETEVNEAPSGFGYIGSSRYPAGYWFFSAA